MNFAQIVVIAVSLVVICAPFVMAWNERNHRDGPGVTFYLGLGVLALVWVGFTAARLVVSLSGVA